MQLKRNILLKLSKILLIFVINLTFLLFLQKTTFAQNCCSVPSDCPPIAGYTPKCLMHDAGCPQWVCSYSPGGSGGGSDINWYDLERISAQKFANQPVGTIVSALVKYLFPLAGLLLLLYLIYGGYRYMLSRGDPKALQEARSVITTALIGFVIVFVSFWLVQIIGTMLGLDIITTIF